MDANVLNALNEAGEALKALGEDRTSLHFFRHSGKFHVCLPVPGGVGSEAGTGDTPAEAYAKAAAKRNKARERLAFEAEVRAEIERRRAEAEAA